MTKQTSRGSIFGTILLRMVIPIWVLTGAGVKLYTLNPKLLPEPILNLIQGTGQMLDVSDLGWWLGMCLRFLIGTEIALALFMIFSPRVARTAASFTLGVFLAVLIATMAQAASRDGISAIWSSSCGCFGSVSPPPIIMFIADGLLLAGIIFFPPIPEKPKNGPGLILIGGLCLGFGLAFIVPDRTITIENTPDPSKSTADTDAFPPMPTTLNPNYFTTFTDWVGTPLSSHPLAQIISRPLPDWIGTDRFHVVFYRADCEHCHELMENFFAGPLETPVIAVQVPDHDPNNEMAMPCDECLLHTLPEGPSYVITTPVLMTVEGGTVLSVCEDSEDHAAVMDTINAGAPATDANSAAAPATPTDAWGDMPRTLEPYYFPDFEEWTGTELASHPFARLMERPIPEYLKEGRGFLIFYRADCDHCHHMIEQWFTDSLPGPTLAVVIPDTPPEGAMEFPSTLVDRGTLPKGPDYVMSTPALLTIVDGVVKCYASDPDDIDQVETCLATD